MAIETKLKPRWRENAESVLQRRRHWFEERLWTNADDASVNPGEGRRALCDLLYACLNVVMADDGDEPLPFEDPQRIVNCRADLHDATFGVTGGPHYWELRMIGACPRCGRETFSAPINADRTEDGQAQVAGLLEFYQPDPVSHWCNPGSQWWEGPTDDEGYPIAEGILMETY